MPPRQDIGQQVSAAVKPLATEILRAGRDYRWAPTDDAPLLATAVAHAHLSPPTGKFRNPYDTICDGLGTRLSLLRDFLDGISLVCVHGASRPRPVAFSAVPIVRGAMESLAYLYWIAALRIDDDERRIRHGVDLAHHTGSWHRLDKYADADGHTIDPNWNELAAMFDQWDIEYTQKRRGAPVQVIDADGTRRKRPSAMEIVAPLMPSADNLNVGAFFMYSINDIMHASLDGALREADVRRDDDGQLRVTFSRPGILRTSAGIFWACYRPLKVVYSLLGWDVQRLDSVFDARVQPLADAIADSLGVPRERVKRIGNWADYLPEHQEDSTEPDGA